MNHKFLFGALSACLLVNYALADKTEVQTVRLYESLPITNAIVIGTDTALASTLAPIDDYVNVDALAYKTVDLGAVDADGMCIIGCTFENRRFTEYEITIDGLDKYKAYVDGRDLKPGRQSLHPGTHTLTVKFVSDTACSPVISIDSSIDGAIALRDDDKRMFTLEDVMYGTKISNAQISPSGTYILVNYRDVLPGDRSIMTQKLYDVKSGRFVSTVDRSARWLNRSDKYWMQRSDYQHGRHIVAVDPATGREEILVDHLPEGSYLMGPADDFLIYSLVREGRKEDPEIYQVIEPEDRQPGWRDRHYPAIYRFDSQVLQPLVVSNHDVNVADISNDGTKLLLMETTLDMSSRPTTKFNLLTLDIPSMTLDTLVYQDGFISDACFSPDGKRVAVIGGPEAFDRAGCVLPEDKVPSMYDNQLFTINLADGTVKPLTRDFDPSINAMYWSDYDGKIYVTVTERDMYNAYSIDPDRNVIRQLELPENVINGLSLATVAPVIAVWGQSDSAPDALYTYNVKSGASALVDRPSAERLKDVNLGECHDWTFVNDKGETVYCRYYLPDNFDPDKKYPLIVNYYGGCTPSTRLFESRYPLHVYSSLGYVVLQIQPSGATGFGQDWSSRHVSTAGKGVAEDIIEGTRQFCKEMPYVNADKIGCIGASYGGFMTQYLLTQTDMFSAGISHAGISDHTSYWGEGYWGYSYSETSMGNDMPWTSKSLYVDQSPLYNAYKIHTPLLLIHGDSDHNVPIGESIQMFTALKRLGQDVALVQVTGEDHHIMTDSKRKKWQDTIFAWFAKYLQDDPTWWEVLYPAQNLN